MNFDDFISFKFSIIIYNLKINLVMLAQPEQRSVDSGVKRKKEQNLASIFVRNSKKQAIKLNMPRQLNVKQFKQAITKRMGTGVDDQVLFLHGKQIDDEKEQINLFDGLIFHLVNLKKVNMPQISFTVRRIEPNSVSHRFTVDSKMEIQSFMKNMFSLHFIEPNSYFLVHTGRQLNAQNCFQDEFVEDGCELLAVHKIENRKSQNMTLKKQQFKKPMKDIPIKKQDIKAQEKQQDWFKKREKKRDSNTEQKYGSSQSMQENTTSGQISQVESKIQNSTRIVSIKRQQDEQQVVGGNDLYQTAKFNSVEEMRDMRLKKDKQPELQQLQQGEKGIEMDETEQIIIGNYNAQSYGQDSPINGPSADKEDKLPPSNSSISTRYGLVPKKQSSQFSRESCEVCPISQSEPAQIVAIKDQVEQNNSPISVQYLGHERELLENSPDKPSLKSSFTPSMTQMTLKTISSHYDQEQINSSTKSKIEQHNYEDQNESIIYDNVNSIRYSPIGIQQTKNSNGDRQQNLYLSNRQSGEVNRISFIKKPKMEISTLGELTLVNEEGKVQTSRNDGVKELSQTVDPKYFRPYQTQESDAKSYHTQAKRQRDEEIKFTGDQEQPVQLEQRLDQSQVKINLQDSDATAVNKIVRTFNQDSKAQQQMKNTISYIYQQKPKQNFTNQPEKQKNENQASQYFEQKRFSDPSQFEQISQVRLSTGESENMKRYPHTSNISEATSIYQANLSDCPSVDPQEVMGRFPHFQEMNLRNSFTSDVEYSTYKWEGNGNSAGIVHSDLYSAESQTYMDNPNEIQTSKVEDIEIEESPNVGQQQKNDENNHNLRAAQPFDEEKHDHLGKNIQGSGQEIFRNNQHNQQDSMLLEDNAKSHKIISSSSSLTQMQQNNGDSEVVSGTKLEEEDDNLLNYVLNSSEKFVRKKQFAYLGDMQNSLTQEAKLSLENQPLKLKMINNCDFAFSCIGKKQKSANLKMGDLIMIANTEALGIIDNKSRAYINKEADENIVEALRADILLEFYQLQDRPQISEKVYESEVQETPEVSNLYHFLGEKRQDQQNLLLEYL